MSLSSSKSNTSLLILAYIVRQVFDITEVVSKEFGEEAYAICGKVWRKLGKIWEKNSNMLKSGLILENKGIRAV